MTERSFKMDFVWNTRQPKSSDEKCLTDRDYHEGSWYPESRRVAGLLACAGDLLPEDGREDGADQTAGVDGSVEQREVSFHVFLKQKFKFRHTSELQIFWLIYQS